MFLLMPSETELLILYWAQDTIRSIFFKKALAFFLNSEHPNSATQSIQILSALSIASLFGILMISQKASFMSYTMASSGLQINIGNWEKMEAYGLVSLAICGGLRPKGLRMLSMSNIKPSRMEILRSMQSTLKVRNPMASHAGFQYGPMESPSSRDTLKQGR